jgi:hypothetical protein
MPQPGFSAYPPAQKVKSRRDFRMVSNVSARKKWLVKNVPEWNGPEIWSEKRVKKYISDVKNRSQILPVAKRVKIPWAWDCRRVVTFATVVTDSDSDIELDPYIFNNYLNVMGFSGI